MCWTGISPDVIFPELEFGDWPISIIQNNNTHIKDTFGIVNHKVLSLCQKSPVEIVEKQGSSICTNFNTTRQPVCNPPNVQKLSSLIKGHMLIYPERCDFKGDLKDIYIIQLMKSNNLSLDVLLDFFMNDRDRIREKTLFQVLCKWADEAYAFSNQIVWDV